MLREVILSARSGDEASMLSILEQFSPLLRKYAHLLHTEDAFSDLQTELICLIHTIPTEAGDGGDGVLVSYIARSIRNAYIKLSKKQGNLRSSEISLQDMSEQQNYRIEAIISTPSADETWDFWAVVPRDLLTKREAFILYMIFDLGYTAAEVTRQMGTTRQNVNQSKRKALNKLKNALSD